MRKFVLLLASVFTILLSVSSQTTDRQKVSFGIKSGINVSRLQLNEKIPDGVNSDLRTGFVAGAFLTFPVGKSRFSIQPEFLYSSMGGDLSDRFNEKQNFRFNYFSIPVLIKYQFSKKLAAFAGPQADAIVYAKGNNRFGEFNITQSVEEFDAYATLGLEWWLTKDIVLNGRYMHGFMNVHTIPPDISMNNRGLQITLGLRFRKARPWPEEKTVVIAPPVDKDTDGDGIFDSRDKCPTVPGVVKYEGCPVPDTDKDGIFDDKDKCPDMAGYPELEGCPYPDRDKDGVTDNKDRCPDEPGSTKNDGCPITDTDGDGVPDDTDRCPDTPGPASNNGCPEDVKTKLTYIAKNIYFNTNKATLQNISYDPLNQLVDILNKYPTAKLTIEGHTDNTGTNAHNMQLSESRAKTVMSYLTGKGIPANRLTAVGYGEENPVATNNTAEGRTLNRRVELKLIQ
ncbi:MAG TPA: OmpA family protein [Chitinophagaceae bacterium]|nr:OmpA family protein [Chitinophagaceae bacterium]